MKQTIFLLEDGRLRRLAFEARGPARWASWHPRGDSALLAGDRGSLTRFSGGEFRQVSSGTDRNLRCVAFHPDGARAYACGNSGALLRIEDDRVTPIEFDRSATLRRLAWNSTGERALAVGNGGVAFVMDRSERPTTALGAETHLRSVAWHPTRDTAIVTGNCFRDSIGGLTPSPNLFKLQGDLLAEISDLEASRDDLTCASWHPSGSDCLISGFDQTWHTAALVSYSEAGVARLEWGEERLFPTSCSWEPSGSFALIGTTPLTGDEGTAALYQFDRKERSVTKIADLEGRGASCIAWRGETALIACSSTTRAYSA